MPNNGMDTSAALPERGIARVVTLPPPAPGFVGEGHTAVPVVEPGDFGRTDPFILLMDDRIDLPPGRPRAVRIRTRASRSRRLSWRASCATATRDSCEPVTSRG
jgi:hypothetical protein